MEYLNRFCKFLIGIIILLILVVLMFLAPLNAHASNIDEETVLNDLKQDPNFNIEDYPDDYKDYSLQVIQLAETKENELVVYAYQPSDKNIDLLGTKISISYGFSQNGKGLKPKLYDLSLLSSNGVFDKYLIKDFPVPGDSQRYYNIVSIFREFNEVIDEDKTIDNDYYDRADISFSVGQQWYIYDINDIKGYEMATFNTLTIDTVFGSKFEFNSGLTWGNFSGVCEKGDCWYIAFNCEEYVIKHIYDADMSYSKQYIEKTSLGAAGSTFKEGDPEENIPVRLTDQDVMTYTGIGLLASTYKWNRILSSSEFIKNVEKNKVVINEDAKKKIQQSQWVFTYAITERNYIPGGNGYYVESYYNVYDVGILRLHFLDVSGKIYDLGIVNSLIDPTDKSSGYGKATLDALEEFFEKLFMMLGIVILYLILIVLSNFFPPLKFILELIVNAIVFTISLPFKIFKWVFKRK